MTRPGAPARALGRRVGRGLALVAAAGLAGVVGLAGDATRPGPPAAAQSTPTLRLRLRDQDLAFRPGETLRFRYRLTGDLGALQITPATTGPAAPRATAGTASTTGADAAATGEPGAPADETADGMPDGPPELVVQVTNYPVVRSSDQLGDMIGSTVDRDAFRGALDGVELTAVRASLDVRSDRVAVLDVEVPTDTGRSEADKLRFDDVGVHPVRVELLTTDGEGGRTLVATAGTVVQRLPGDDDAPDALPVDLALVAAVDQLPAAADADVVAAARADVEDVVDYAAAVDPPVAAALPPDLLADVADEDGTDLAAALADDELISVPAAPLDVSSAAAVDRVDAFARLLRAGEDTLTEVVPTTPTRRDVWIATSPLSAEGAQVLRDLGTRFVVMTPDIYARSVSGPTPATDQFVELALPDGGTLPLLLVDEIGAALTPGSRPRGTTTTELALELVAGVLVDSGVGRPVTDPAATAEARSRIVAAPDLAPLDPRLVGAVVDVAGTTPDVRFSPASRLTGVTGVQEVAREPIVVDLPPQAGPALDARIERLDGAGLAMLSAASMLPEDDPRRTEWSNELDSLISTAYTDAEVEAQVDALLVEADRLKGAVVPPEPFTFTLTGRTGEIEIPIGNRLDEPVRVVVHLQSPKLVFPEGDSEVVLQPGDETRVVVPVRARANGTSPVSVDVRTPLGEDIIDTVRLTSRVNALTGIGQVVTGGLVVVLLTWWFTHWRGRRRQLALESAERHPSRAG